MSEVVGDVISWQPELTICLSSNLMFAKLKRVKRGTSAMFAVVLYSSCLRLFLLFKYKKIMFCFMHIHQQKFFFFLQVSVKHLWFLFHAPFIPPFPLQSKDITPHSPLTSSGPFSNHSSQSS